MVVKVNGNKFIQKDIRNGKSNFTVYGLAPGSYDVDISFTGDYNYKSANRTERIVIPEGNNSADSSSFSFLNTLIQMADNEIRLEKDYAFNDAMDSDFKDGVVLYKPMSIDGGESTIDGKGQSRAFFIYNRGIVLKNITIVNGNSTEGGAIFAYYSFALNDSRLISNSAGDGGAIYSYDDTYIVNSTCHIINTKLLNNSYTFIK